MLNVENWWVSQSEAPYCTSTLCSSYQTPHRKTWWTSYLACLPTRDTELHHLPICWPRSELKGLGHQSQRLHEKDRAANSKLLCTPLVSRACKSEAGEFYGTLPIKCANLFWTQLEIWCVFVLMAQILELHKHKIIKWHLKTNDKTTMYAHPYK